MSTVKAYIVHDSKSDPVPGEVQRRALNDDDVEIKIKYCGICHSDLHVAHNDWGNTKYPFVGGHEILGEVEKVGDKVTNFKKGDLVGVGCIVSTCGDCKGCETTDDNWCKEKVGTYNSPDRDGTITSGGYSERVVVRERCVLKMPTNIDPAEAAPLLCAGITSYSPLVSMGVKPGEKVGVAGLGGLGAMAVKLAVAMGCEVTVISRNDKKQGDAKELGAQRYLNVSDEEQVKQAKESLNYIVDTIPVDHDIDFYLSLLDYGGKLCITGVIGDVKVSSRALMIGNKSVTASNIGSIRETQEMLDFCGKHNIGCESEVIPYSYISEAYKRVHKGDVKYRFVLDTSTI